MNIKVIPNPSTTSKLVAISDEEGNKLIEKLKEKKASTLMPYLLIIKGVFVGQFKLLSIADHYMVELTVSPSLYDSIDKYLQNLELGELSAISTIE